MQPRIAEEAGEAELERAVRGDSAALAAVARAWRSRIRRWALLELGDPALAEDACQDALVQLVRHIDRYDPGRPFAPWLRTVVRNCCHQVRRRHARHLHEVLDDEHAHPGGAPDPERALDVGRATDAAVRGFEALTPRQRELMHLCTADGLTAAEAARELGIAPSTARVLMFKARQTLLSALAALGGMP